MNSGQTCQDLNMCFLWFAVSQTTEISLDLVSPGPGPFVWPVFLSGSFGPGVLVRAPF